MLDCEGKRGCGWVGRLEICIYAASQFSSLQNKPVQAQQYFVQTFTAVNGIVACIMVLYRLAMPKSSVELGGAE